MHNFFSCPAVDAWFWFQDLEVLSTAFVAHRGIFKIFDDFEFIILNTSGAMQ